MYSLRVKGIITIITIVYYGGNENSRIEASFIVIILLLRRVCNVIH